MAKRRMLKSKLHRATVTDANLDYNGSITVDPELMELADLVEYEQVDVYNITNGSRFTTYVISGTAGDREICINGAAAHLAKPKDLVIICSYFELEDEESRTWSPRTILLGPQNLPQN